MKAVLRFSPLFVLALALALAACSEDEKELPDFATLFPADNQIGSFVEAPVDPSGIDRANKEAGPWITTNEEDITARIDGAAAEFYAAGFANFGFELYTDDTCDIDLALWQMESPDGATTAMTNASTGGNWADANLGEAGRVDNNGTSSLWYWFIRKGVYVIELTSEPTSGGSGTRDGARTAGETFATAILAKMP